MFSDRDDPVYDLMDQVQRANQMLSWLVSHAGGDPQEVGRLPDEQPEERKAA